MAGSCKQRTGDQQLDRTNYTFSVYFAARLERGGRCDISRVELDEDDAVSGRSWNRYGYRTVHTWDAGQFGPRTLRSQKHAWDTSDSAPKCLKTLGSSGHSEPWPQLQA